MNFRRLAAAFLLIASSPFLFANEEDPLNRKLSTEGFLPVLASDIEEGTYQIEAASSSSMFRIEKTVLHVKDGAMTAELTLSGTGYSNVVLLSEKDAALSSRGGTEPAVAPDGKYVFTVSVPALNTELVCSAFSKKKQKWYERRVVFYSEKIPAENLFVAPYTMQAGSLKDGAYTVAVTLSGGSGRASVKSPATLLVKNGMPVAQIEWSSPHYDYMVLNKEKFLPLPNHATSVFEIPVLAFDKPLSVIADTTAMGTPHEILYQLEFKKESIQKSQGGIFILIPLLVIAAALIAFFSIRLCKKKNR